MFVSNSMISDLSETINIWMQISKQYKKQKQIKE